MAEILSGIRSAFNLRIGMTGSTERQFTGAYSGTLQRVLSHLLDGELHHRLGSRWHKHHPPRPERNGAQCHTTDRHGEASER